MNFYQIFKSFFRIISVLFILVIAITTDAYSWGGTGHRIINLKAPMHLPASMSSLKADSLFYASHASDADYRKNSTDTSFFAETLRHYIDIDIYPNFHNLPHSLDSVIMIYGRSYVRSQGTLPWTIKLVMDSLTAQLMRGNTAKAESTMSDLGHYIADAHMPLHCTANYWVGGLHSRYETDMINMCQPYLIIQPDSAHYINSPLDYAFETIYHSNFLVDSVIQADTYAKSVSGWSGSGTPPTSYYSALWLKSQYFTKDQFQRGTVALASLWYTAWVNSHGSSFASDKQNINFSDLMILDTKLDSLTVINSGPATLNISSVTSSNSEFVVNPISSTILPWATQKFFITFSPTSAGTKTSNLIFMHNGITLKDTVILSGMCIAPATFTINTKNIIFSDVNVGNNKRDSVTVTNPGSSILNISSVTSSYGEFTVSPVSFSIGPMSSQKFYITFTPVSSGIKTGYLVFAHNAITFWDTINVTGTGALLSFAATVGANWNLVSVPLTVSDYAKAVLYPTSVSEAFAFQNTYNAETVLTKGVGYWLKFDQAQTVNISGLPLNLDTVAVVSGWNLIGSISNSILVASINQIPSGIVSSSFYGYQTGYYLADSINPGRGYWVKVNQDGKLVLNADIKVNKESVKNEQLQTLNRLTIEDKVQNSQIIYFGKADDSFIQKYELPPLPPSGIFDARYANDNLIESVKKGQTKYVPIFISSAEYPVSIAWELGNPLVSASLLIDEKEIPLKSNGSVYLKDTRSKVVLKLTDTSSLPKEFVLSQNFPNPFNPTTVISYQLPERSDVKLFVYDVLGREVAKLVDEMQESGYKTVTLDASNLSSGIYFYGIETTNLSDPSKSFTQVRKLILMK
jgi:hypothetical protein